jgi:hypothetical protein
MTLSSLHIQVEDASSIHSFISPAKDMNEVPEKNPNENSSQCTQFFFEKNGPFVHPPPSISR